MGETHTSGDTMRIEPLPQLPFMAPPPPATPASQQASPAVTPRQPDLIVLSAAAYRALVSAPRSPSTLAGTFDISVASASGRLQVGPGPMEGVVSVSIDLFHVPVWPDPPGPIRTLHLEAHLRSSWVARVTTPEAPPEAHAQQIAEAVTQLARIPGQRTVDVTAER